MDAAGALALGQDVEANSPRRKARPGHRGSESEGMLSSIISQYGGKRKSREDSRSSCNTYFLFVHRCRQHSNSQKQRETSFLVGHWGKLEVPIHPLPLLRCPKLRQDRPARHAGISSCAYMSSIPNGAHVACVGPCL